MQDGLYKVAFKTPLGEGFGVVVLHGGRLQGGDSMMFYQGTYSEEAGKFTASVQTSAHSHVPGMISVFGASNNQAAIHLNGTSTGDSAVASGTSPDAPGVQLSAILTRLA